MKIISLIKFLIFLILLTTALGCGNKHSLAPGIEHRHWIDESGPWAIHVITVDLTSPGLQVSVIKANHRISSRAKTSAMAQDASKDGLAVAAAVNADFFSLVGKPVGLCVQNGEIVTPPTGHPVFGITTKGTPFIETVELCATLFAPADSYVLAVNYRTKNTTCLFNHFYSDSLNLCSGEIAYAIAALDAWTTNEIVRAIIVSIDSISAQEIPASGALLVSSKKEMLAVVGDTLKILLSLPPITTSICQAVGGIPRIVRDGKMSVEWKGNSFNLERHPRTAVGYSQDKTKLFIVTVDGRQPGYSDGMTLDELANFMIGIGAHRALNLDGGGSTTMVIFGKVVNRPSDITGERPVSNALLISKTSLK